LDMQKRYAITATSRTVLGKKVKQLRRDGLVPANIYGRNVEPLAITLSELDFSKVYKQAGETGLIDISIASEGQSRPVLVHSLLRDPVYGQILHIDLYQVNLKEKLVAAVPLEFVGESPVVKNKEGILLELLQEVEVESLPTDIPSSIEVDISLLVEVDQGVHVGDLVLPAGVEMQTDAEELVCKIEPAQMSEAEAGEEAEAETSEEQKETAEPEGEA
jgi:large subunit ribosomal protein L25